jgi:hypothetical protein
MTEAFVRNIEDFVNHEGIDLVAFEKWQRKDDVTQKYLTVRGIRSRHALCGAQPGANRHRSFLISFSRIPRK